MKKEYPKMADRKTWGHERRPTVTNLALGQDQGSKVH